MIIKRNKQKKLVKPQVQPQAPVEQFSADVSYENQQDFSSVDVVQETEVVENVEPEQQEVSEPEADSRVVKEDTSDIFAGFNFDSAEFSQRAERRRGDRRRGYRRIDDRNMISRAQEEAIMIKEQAFKEGFQKGLDESGEVISGLRDAVEGFFSYKEEVYEKLSADILDIALKVAQKIIRKEVASDKSVLDGIVKEALKSLAKDENKIILKVNPTDVEYTKEIVPELLSTGQLEAKIYVTGDKEVEEGSAIIETSNGVIDANIRAQLEVIKEAFKNI